MPVPPLIRVKQALCLVAASGVLAAVADPPPPRTDSIFASQSEFEAAVPYTVDFLVDLWGRAQVSAGLPDTSVDGAKKIFDWHSTAGAGAQHGIVVGYENLAYVRIYKCATEMVEANLGQADGVKPHSSAYDDSLCWWTLVREPIGRFVSAYTEMEYRYIKGLESGITDQYGDSVPPSQLKDDGWSFGELPAGSKERAAAFVKDLLKLLWTINPEQTPSGLFFNQAFAHVAPMSATTWPYKFDFVGRLDRDVMETEWACMNQVCGTNVAYNGDAGQHPTSSDPNGSKEAMESALEEDSALRCALYMIYWPDFVNFGFEPPEGCEAIVQPFAPETVLVDPWSLGKQKCGNNVSTNLLSKSALTQEVDEVSEDTSVAADFLRAEAEQARTSKRQPGAGGAVVVAAAAVATMVLLALVVVTHRHRAVHLDQHPDRPKGELEPTSRSQSSTLIASL